MTDDVYLHTLAEKTLNSVATSDEVLDYALEQYCDAHPDLEPGHEYGSDYHVMFEQAILEVVSHMFMIQAWKTQIPPLPQTSIFTTITVFAHKHSPNNPKEYQAFMEDLRRLMIAIEIHFRHSQIAHEFTDGTGDKFLEVCAKGLVSPLIEP